MTRPHFVLALVVLGDKKTWFQEIPFGTPSPLTPVIGPLVGTQGQQPAISLMLFNAVGVQLFRVEIGDFDR